MLIILVLESRSWFGVPFGSLIAWLWSVSAEMLFQCRTTPIWNFVIFVMGAQFTFFFIVPTIFMAVVYCKISRALMKQINYTWNAYAQIQWEEVRLALLSKSWNISVIDELSWSVWLPFYVVEYWTKDCSHFGNFAARRNRDYSHYRETD
jgi:hypothetical protein